MTVDRLLSELYVNISVCLLTSRDEKCVYAIWNQSEIINDNFMAVYHCLSWFYIAQTPCISVFRDIYNLCITMTPHEHQTVLNLWQLDYLFNSLFWFTLYEISRVSKTGHHAERYLSGTHDDVIKWKLFRVTGHLCGEFTGLRWIPRTKASDAELWCFLWSVSK